MKKISVEEFKKDIKNICSSIIKMLHGNNFHVYDCLINNKELQYTRDC